MPMNSRFFILAASLVAVPLAGALAQGSPTSNLGSNTSVTASPGTADNKAMSGLSTSDVHARRAHPTRMARNHSSPGATGRAVVPGDSSTVSGDSAATVEQKTGALTK